MGQSRIRGGRPAGGRGELARRGRVLRLALAPRRRGPAADGSGVGAGGRGGPDGQRYPWGDAIPDWVPNRGRGPLDGPWAVTLGTPNGFGLYGIGATFTSGAPTGMRATSTSARRPSIRRARTRAGGRASRGGAWRHALTLNRTAARSQPRPVVALHRLRVPARGLALTPPAGCARGGTSVAPAAARGRLMQPRRLRPRRPAAELRGCAGNGKGPAGGAARTPCRAQTTAERRRSAERQSTRVAPPADGGGAPATAPSVPGPDGTHGRLNQPSPPAARGSLRSPRRC